MRFLGWSVRIIGLAAMISVAGCAADLENDMTTGAIAPPADQRPSDDDVAMGKKHYVAANYGLAERHFRAAVEVNPRNAPAWLGLAASYDRLARYDLAKRAYDQTIALQGRTSVILNNLGYHHLLRGNLKQARKLFNEANQKDPDNPHIQGNLQLLENWHTGERPPGLQDKIVEGIRH